MILLAGVAQLLTSLALTVITAAFNAQIVSNGAPSQAIYNLFGIALLVIVLGAALPAIWITIQFLAAASGVGAGAAAGVGVAATTGRAVNTTVTTALRSIL